MGPAVATFPGPSDDQSRNGNDRLMGYRVAGNLLGLKKWVNALRVSFIWLFPSYRFYKKPIIIIGRGFS